MRILVVEDDLEAQRYLVQGLKESGHVVDEAGDGETGLSLALSRPYDIAVIDRMLPGLDGLKVVAEMREHAFAFLGEQRRTEQLGQLVVGHLTGPHPRHRHISTDFRRLLHDDRLNDTSGQKFVIPQQQVQVFTHGHYRARSSNSPDLPSHRSIGCRRAG